MNKLIEDKRMLQKQVASAVGVHPSNYSTIESGQREISIAAIDKIANYFNITIDELVHLGNDIPKEISLEDKTTVEQVKIIQELNSDDKKMVFAFVDVLVGKKKLKDALSGVLQDIK